jgi:glucose/arabinose dehydrogenase
MKRSLILTSLLIALTAGVFASAQDTPTTSRSTAPDPASVRLTEIARGLNRPLFVTDAGDGSGRLFVVEQGGRVWILQNGERLTAPFMDVSFLVSPEANGFGYTERGLLGLAFHPDFVNNGIFFINYTDLGGSSVVARYRVSATNPNAADLDSAEILLVQSQPYPNHNGGHVLFGPDGYLYIGFGDGGSQGDPQGNGQNLGTWLGKVLRIEVGTQAGYRVPDDNPFVGTPGALPEIWAYGLRNPWRFSFDRATQDLYIGDVGGSSWEEINFQPADSAGGENYGWSLYEGMHPVRNASAPADLVMPIAEYSHQLGISVSGGYVYRGTNIPELQGVYLYGDFGYGTIWSAWRDATSTWQSQVLMSNTGYTISSFGEDASGELYIVNYGGSVVRLDPAS